MADHEQVHVNSRQELRAWLAANHAQSESIWLVTYKKHVPDKYVAWDEIVQEALCFGWIDSLPRKLDADRSMLRLSPRRKGSAWSARNKQHIEELLAAGLMAAPGLAAIERAKADGSWTLLDDVEALIVPDDLAAALAANPEAQAQYDAFTDASKRGVLWWIKSARRPATRQKRIAETVRLAALGLRGGHPESKGSGV